MMQTLYQAPKYYEIAFSFRDILKEVDLFEAVIRQYSKIPVARVLEVACGNSPHLEELVRRGYTYTGIDLSPDMLAYTRQKAKRLSGHVELIQANMTDFRLSSPVDFAYIMLGSLYVKNTTELYAHFAAMEQAVQPGGLYLLDWCVEFAPLANKQESWDMEQDGIRVHTTYATTLLNWVEQTFAECITLQVDDHGQQQVIEEMSVRRAIFPQEFLLLVAHRTQFEFIGWWDNWNLSAPLQGTENISRPVIVLRRKAN